MCQSDLYPTEYDLKPIVLNQSTSLSITEMEIQALKGIDLAERITDPINRFSVARGVIKLSAHVARKFRNATR
jgi:hypothetical protein